MTKKDNQLIQQHYNELAQLAFKYFDIEISVEKMLIDKGYREVVLNELSNLGNLEINLLCQQLETNQISDKKTSKTAISPFYFVAVTITLLVLFSLYFYMANPSLQYSTPDQPNVAVNQVVEQPAQLQSEPTIQQAVNVNEVNAVTSLPVNDPEILFKLHGSNTIGEKLAPALLEAYFKSQGVNQFYWQQGHSNVERVLQFRKKDKVYGVELQAHGSSTAFQGLSITAADIGMSSRRVKSKEREQLLTSLGDLNKVGNEHIIGLDGLAVIVNQNNNVKELTNETLAKIFAGEITNWSAIGGVDKKINVFARDKNSGTWDTFKNLVLKKYNKKLASNAERLESSSELSLRVSQDEFAIGFIGLNYIQHNKALAISAGKGSKSIFPTRFTISTEDYALSRRLYFYTPTSAPAIVKDFAQFAISVAGQDVVEQTGSISQNIKEERVYPMAGAPQSYNEYAQQGKRLSLNFRFDYSNIDLDNKGKRDLYRLVDYMEKNAGRRLVLMGFSDSIGAKDKNETLSLKRALSVEKELLARGITVTDVKGMGELFPVANNNSEAGRERNRRVEVWIL